MSTTLMPTAIRNGCLVLVLFLIGTMLGGCGYEYNGTLYEPPMDAAEVVGTNWDGSEFQMSDLQGKIALVFFGYTACPDICPFSMATMTQVHAQLGEKAEDVAMVFISVDPERDTPERLAEYVPAFNDAFYGVHIPEPELSQTKADYFVYAEKSYPDGSESSIDYLVDHTGWIYVIDRQGRMRMVFGHDTPADQITPDIQHLLKARR